jgi:WhiB family redox-sensing transcriptional regulator
MLQGFSLPKDYPDFSSQGAPPCSEAMPDAYFPEGSSSYTYARSAKKICSTCPYQIACLEYALKNNELGIWGGTTEGERRRMKRTGASRGRPKGIR